MGDNYCSCGGEYTYIEEFGQQLLQCQDCGGTVQPGASELERLRTLTLQQAEEIAKLRGDNEQAYISLALENIRTGSIREGIAELIRQQAEQIAKLKRDADRWTQYVATGYPKPAGPSFTGSQKPTCWIQMLDGYHVSFDSANEAIDALAKPMPKAMEKQDCQQPSLTETKTNKE